MTYSIIIPHHGPEELLQRLLSSIPKREDTEVIVAEDKDSRGAGWARNEGLKQAKGEYLIFADDDDYFLPCFNEILDMSHTADVIYFSASSISWRSARLNWVMAQEPSYREDLLRQTFTEPWCLIVKRSLVEQYNIRFDETPILNDVRFSTQVGYYAKTVEVIPLKAYYIENLPNSVGKRKDASRLIAYAKVMAETNIFNRQHNIPRYHARMLRPFMRCLATGKFVTAQKCWKVMRHAGFSDAELIKEVINYPRHLLHWMRRRRKYAQYV